MKISIQTTSLKKLQKTCIMVGIFEDGKLSKTAAEIDKMSDGYIKKFLAKGIFQGKIGQSLSLFNLPNTAFEQIILVGCGRSTDQLTAQQLNKTMISAIKTMNSYSASSQAVCYLTELTIKNQSSFSAVKYLTEIIYSTYYCFDRFKSKKTPPPILQDMLIALPDNLSAKEGKQAILQGTAIAQGMNLTKDLANLPSNICTPTFLSQEAKKLTKAYSTI